MEAHHHHNHNSSASHTQSPSFVATAKRSLHPLSSGTTNSRADHALSSADDVPLTTIGPTTISIVIALTLAICMILNCGKLRRKLNLHHTKPLLIDAEKNKNQNKPRLLDLSPPSSTGESFWPTTSTLFYPTFPPPVAQQSRIGSFYPPHYYHP